MTRNKQKTYAKLKNAPSNASFSDICRLAEQVGFVFRNQKGSHKVYKHPRHRYTMNFQPDKKDKSKAKKYQVAQLIGFIDEHNLIKKGK